MKNTYLLLKWKITNYQYSVLAKGITNHAYMNMEYTYFELYIFLITKFHSETYLE